MSEVNWGKAMETIEELNHLRAENARLVKILNESRSDEEIDYSHIIKFWEEHTAPGNPHHSIHEWLEWLWAKQAENARLEGEIEKYQADNRLLREQIRVGDSAYNFLLNDKKNTIPECALTADLQRHKEALEKAREALDSALWGESKIPTPIGAELTRSKLFSAISTINEVLK